MDLYDRINLKLKENGMTRKELATKINISYHSINGLYRRRSSRVKLSIIKQIATALNTSVEFLANGTESAEYEDHDILDIYNNLSLEDQNEFKNYGIYLMEKAKSK